MRLRNVPDSKIAQVAGFSKRSWGWYTCIVYAVYGVQGIHAPCRVLVASGEVMLVVRGLDHGSASK